MSKKFLKLIMALSLVLAFTGCTITVVEDDPEPSAPVLEYKYKYTSYCEGTSDDACEDLGESSYVRIIGELIKGQIVTIEAYLPGDPHPNLSEDFYYDGRKEDALGTYYDFYSVSENPATSFAIYDGDYASYYEEENEDWMYNFSNIADLYKKMAK